MKRFAALFVGVAFIHVIPGGHAFYFLRVQSDRGTFARKLVKLP